MISVFGSCLGEEEVLAASEVIRSQWIGMGKKTELFENEMRAFLRSDNFLMVNSGSSALQLAVTLLELPAGSEIILPSFTWVACANAIVLAGCKPVFCDVELETQNVNCELIKEKISDKTRAIMLVHYAGKPIYLDNICKLGFPVIEDAAHAVASKKGNKSCGTVGDIGIYSFDSIKNIACGEAGGIVCKNPEMATRAKKLRYSGVEKSGFQNANQTGTKNWWKHEVSEAFPKMIPTDISAAIGLEQLKKLATHQEVRKQQWQKYQDAFQAHSEIICPVNPEGDEVHSYFTYLIRLKNRNEVAEKLLECEIYSTLRYHPLHMSHFYQSDISLPNCEEIARTGLNIPLHPRLTKEEQNFVIQSILKWI